MQCRLGSDQQAAVREQVVRRMPDLHLKENNMVAHPTWHVQFVQSRCHNNESLLDLCQVLDEFIKKK